MIRILLAAGVVAVGLAAFVKLSRRDVVTVLTGLLFVVIFIPELDQFAPLKSYGNPALIMGFLCFMLWCAGRWLGLLQAEPLHPIRWVILLFAVTASTAFIAGMARPLVGQEEPGSLRGAFATIAFVGVVMLGTDGLRGVPDVNRLLRRIVTFTGVAAAIGLLEFFDHGFQYAALVHVPGLTSARAAVGETRAGFVRVNFTSASPIELSVFLAVVAPIALHYALHAPTVRDRRRAKICFILICAVVPMSLARSGILALAVGMAFYAVQLKRRGRINLLVVALAGVAVLAVVARGIVTAFIYMFQAGSSDPSIAKRMSDYAKIPQLLDGHLFFGRGLGTFNPIQYFFLDNQYLGTLLEGGIVAVVAFGLVFLVGMGAARGVRKRTSDPALRSVGQALAGSIAGLGLSAGTFDEMGFYQTAFMLFIFLGCVGALWTSARNLSPTSPPAKLAGDGAQPHELIQPDSEHLTRRQYRAMQRNDVLK